MAGNRRRLQGIIISLPLPSVAAGGCYREEGKNFTLLLFPIFPPQLWYKVVSESETSNAECCVNSTSNKLM